MAELIVKDELIRELESVSFTEDANKMKVGSDAEMDGFFKGYVEGMLYFIPTTTESEIRAKAIDEFAEKLKDFIAKQVEDAEYYDDCFCDIYQSEVDDLAEQLKQS